MTQTLPAGRIVVHEADCWVASGRLTAASAEQVTDMITGGRAEACDVCKPTPEDIRPARSRSPQGIRKTDRRR
ncbi:DUF6233 domain-containing protein [Streptomyces sp. NPDC050804]|uniref:DUF6233 domain-containing protein n=1 Tax=unclassified Streptomyces TaxID=2593676 RepID=UPI00342FDF30